MKDMSHMPNEERKLARSMDIPHRCRAFTEKVYSGQWDIQDPRYNFTQVFDYSRFYPEKSKYNIYFGDIHGHSNVSDGIPTPDEYWQNLRDKAKLDFGAPTDHEHCGIGKSEMWNGAWEKVRQKAMQYNEPGKFTAILGYERDAYPWYNNMIVYYNSYDAQMERGEVDGEISRQELKALLAREDVLIVPHDTYELISGACLSVIDPELYPPLLEVFSRGDCAEYFGNPYNISHTQCEGGYWQDALRRGARMGCIGASDDHAGYNGITAPEIYGDTLKQYPGITGVLAEENTLEAIFAALKARRCYGFTGGRVWIDFRICGHYMGEEFADNSDRDIYWRVEADAPVKKVTVVKNCRDYVISTQTELVFYDYRAETDCDCYYLRVELEDGRLALTSPIWISPEK